MLRRSCRNSRDLRPRRFVIFWKYKNDAEPRKIVVTNRIFWNADRIVETYRGRWTGTETFHRDGKQELGLGDCQLRDDQGQTRHTYMVFLAYSLLVRELDKTRVSGWAYVKLSTIGESCRALLRESIRTMVGWIVGEVESVARSGGDASRPHRTRSDYATINIFQPVLSPFDAGNVSLKYGFAKV